LLLLLQRLQLQLLLLLHTLRPTPGSTNQQHSSAQPLLGSPNRFNCTVIFAAMLGSTSAATSCAAKIFNGSGNSCHYCICI
jgi:hypothetical protein